jgi:hypothetical protein
MKIAVSFTGTLKDIHNKLIVPSEIEEFHVGCQRQHIIISEHKGLVPMELSWLNKKLRAWHGECGTEISRDLCDDEALWTWDLHMAKWMDRMDAAGKLKYQVGNYPDLVMKLVKEGHEVWYSGTWAKPAISKT